MSIAEAFLKEFDEEMKPTRKLIERYPADKADWKPHPKSFSLAHLTQLVAWMPGWVANAVKETRLDLTKAGKYSNESTATLLSLFDKNVADTRAALSGAKDADFAVHWSLTMGDKVLMSMPRTAVVRQTINHLCHHRGQLTVYLRMLDVPIPSIYGPTADEPWGAK
jgi:uncharacterized damage-inducible protein DinB